MVTFFVGLLFATNIYNKYSKKNLNFLTCLRTFQEKQRKIHVMCQVSCVTCHVSRVMCHVSDVTYQMSHIKCQGFFQEKNIKDWKKIFFFFIISFSACILLQDQVLSEFVTSINSWVMLKPGHAHSWADMLVLAVWQGDPFHRILKLSCPGLYFYKFPTSDFILVESESHENNIFFYIV